ncbi:MAG: CPBP family intramembrane metalloprotease [Kordiimonadaceae bacterium]|nr:CPBP family intramembrane metalloprotease [Kordiimonadaceae bacterium]
MITNIAPHIFVSSYKHIMSNDHVEPPASKPQTYHAVIHGALALCALILAAELFSGGQLPASSEFQILDLLQFVILQPTLETIVFQFAVFRFLRTVRLSYFLIVGLSALAFTVSHLVFDPNAPLLFIAFAGTVLAYLYYFWLKRNRRTAFVLALLVHSLYNYYLLYA